MILKLTQKNKQAEVVLEGLTPADAEKHFNDSVINQHSVVTDLDRKSVNILQRQEAE